MGFYARPAYRPAGWSGYHGEELCGWFVPE
jgi:hypothetical protein